MSSRGTPRVRGCAATAELVPNQHGFPAVLKIRHATRSGERSWLILRLTELTLVQTDGGYRAQVRRFIVAGGLPTTVKAGLNLLGTHVGDPRPPLLPLDKVRLDEMRSLLID